MNNFNFKKVNKSQSLYRYYDMIMLFYFQYLNLVGKTNMFV